MKRSGRDELIQIVIHLCMEAMLGISLYPYLKLAKMLSFLLLLCLLFNKIGEEGRSGSGNEEGEETGKGQRGEGRDDPNNVCTYE
jgi:hypothetical protein